MKIICGHCGETEATISDEYPDVDLKRLVCDGWLVPNNGKYRPLYCPKCFQDIAKAYLTSGKPLGFMKNTP